MRGKPWWFPASNERTGLWDYQVVAPQKRVPDLELVPFKYGGITTWRVATKKRKKKKGRL